MGLRTRVFAALYDRMAARLEQAGLAAARERLLADAEGRVLEVGAGTGLNLAHYPEAVDELVVSEPEEAMARRLERKLGGRHRLVRAPAEALPFEDGSFRTVVGTLVLCSVDDPGRALGEIRRVLEPGGRFLFLEHVRSEDEKVARWQDRLERPWGWMALGCHPNRDTLATIEAAGFMVEEVEHGELPKSPALTRPMIVGRARKGD